MSCYSLTVRCGHPYLTSWVLTFYAANSEPEIFAECVQVIILKGELVGRVPSAFSVQPIDFTGNKL